MDKHHRFIFLDGLRGIAAIAVVIYHFTQHSGSNVLFASSTLAVDLFFCLSGFVIAWSYWDKLNLNLTFYEYVKKRFIRLYPMFIIGMVLGIIALVTKFQLGQTTFSSYQLGVAALLNFFYLPYFNLETVDVYGKATKGVLFPYNNPSWSLFFELVANILFVFTVKFSTRWLVAIALFFGAILAAYALTHTGATGWGTHNFWPGFARVEFSFTAGVIIFKLLNWNKDGFKFSPWLLFVCTLILLAIPRIGHWQHYYVLAVLVLIPSLIMAGARIKIENKLADKILSYIGWISYPLYCVHVPVLYMLSVVYPHPDNFYLFTAISLVGILFLTHYLTAYIDEPIRKYLSKLNRG